MSEVSLGCGGAHASRICFLFFFVPLIPLIPLTFSGKVLLMQNERGRKNPQTCLNCSVLPSVLPFYTSVFMLCVSNLK